MARKNKLNKASKKILTYGLLGLAAIKIFGKKDEETETPTTGIGRAGSKWAIRTDKYGKDYIGYLYYDGKLVYSQGRFPSKSAAKKFMSEISKKGILKAHTTKAGFKKAIDYYHNQEKKSAIITRDKDKLFLY